MSSRLVLRLALNLTGIVLCGFLVHFTSQGVAATKLSILLFAALACLFFGNIEHIKRLKASATGLEAETKEIITEARSTIDDLRALTKDFAIIFFDILNSSGRAGGMPEEFRDRAKEKIITRLEAVGLDQNAINDIKSVEHPYVLFDLAFYISRFARRQKEFPTDKIEKWNSFFSDDRRKGIGNEPTPDELREFLDSMNLLNDDVQRLVEDYEYYAVNKRHRRPEVWAKRGQWSKTGNNITA